VNYLPGFSLIEAGVLPSCYGTREEASAAVAQACGI
jgi:hypothetical protein